MSATATAHDLPRIGGIATMPSRRRSFARVLERILPQLDRLYVFFDAPGHAPDNGLGPWAAHEKIVPLFPRSHGDVHADGKFLGALLFAAPCVYFGFDDDIAYPPDYAARLRAALARYGDGAVVGFHAGVFHPPYRSYVRDRNIAHFKAGVAVDCFADMLGGGTVAFSTAHLSFDPRSWPHHDMGDLFLTIEAVKRGMRRITVQRERHYLTPLAEEQADSLYLGLVRDETRHVALMREALKTYPKAWRLGGIAGPD